MKHRPFKIRAATANDEQHVLALVPRLRAFGPSSFRSDEALDEGERRTLRRFFSESPAGTYLWVAEADGAIAGAAYAELARDYFSQEPHGHLGILMVSESAEGQGIGRALLETVERWSRDAGLRYLSLNVFAANLRAIGMYEKAGYQADFVRYIKLLSQVSRTPGDDA